VTHFSHSISQRRGSGWMSARGRRSAPTISCACGFSQAPPQRTTILRIKTMLLYAISVTIYSAFRRCLRRSASRLGPSSGRECIRVAMGRRPRSWTKGNRLGAGEVNAPFRCGKTHKSVGIDFLTANERFGEVSAGICTRILATSTVRALCQNRCRIRPR
jgi:hypothetical protein